MRDVTDRLAAALVDRYLIERELGAGGMATVYLAQDLKHDRKVAVKVLRPELSAVLGSERFLQEIKTTANLQHPHILPLYDSGEAGGFLYYVMPFVEGESLRTVLDREGRLAPPVAAKIGAAVAEALDFAHRRGVIHRDIKPENILLQDGKPLVADFGIALALTEAGKGRLTETGLSVGSPRYMSPEQAAGERELDPRSDIYALGVTLYEALCGRTPFQDETLPRLIARIVTERAPSVRAVRPDVPARLADAVDRALATQREERFGSAAAFAEALTAPAAETGPRLSPRARRVVAAVTVLLVAVVGLLGGRWMRDRSTQRWIADEVTPALDGLLAEGRFAGAYDLVHKALRRRPGDATLRAVLAGITVPVNITSDPPGARVEFRGYRKADSTWFGLGVTPLADAPVPSGQQLMRFTADGHRALDISVVADFGQVTARLVPEGDPGDMVWIPAGTETSAAEPVPLPTFQIDRLEVTNRAFQSFVAAGGYADTSVWVQPFEIGGQRVGRGEAMARFVDETGRPGPAGWQLSQPPAGREDHPVGGVSWFEAAAYCRAQGKALPTYYHWRRAAGFDVGAWDHILGVSNFGRDSTVPAGRMGGVGPYGTHDMAGNVREWVYNASGTLRYIQGGSWTDPEYIYADGDATDPWSRAPQNGFRCAAYAAPPPVAARAPIDKPFFDFTAVRPVDDVTFNIFRRFYEYVPTDLAGRVEATDTAAYWILQRVSFAAAYGGERVEAYIFLPRNVEPPYQSVVYFPGAGAFLRRTAESLSELAQISFVPRSGRALIYPAYKGSHGRPLADRSRGIARRQWTVWVTQDLQRAVDYVVERADLQDDAIGFLGVSLGAEIAVPVALEKRFAALVLVGGAFDPSWWSIVMPENAPWNFASRITTPAMLINGRRDFMHPYESGQIPYFEAFALPDSAKEFVVLEAGHVPPWNDVIGHALRWYDRYLGPVR